MIAVDAGPIIALFDHGDNHHQRSLKFFRVSDAKFVTNIAVLTEVAHLLSFSNQARMDALKWIVSAFEVDHQTGHDLPRIVEIMTKYADLPADFADASLLAMCERRRIADIATFDKDFEVYTLANGAKLGNVV